MKLVRAMMHRDDQDFLESLGGPLGRGSKWKVFSRRGRVLLVMPASKSGMRAGARMYSPQRRVARLVSACFLKAPVLWRFLPTMRWEASPESPLGSLLKESGSGVGAILLGNPIHEGRRALMVTEGSRSLVFKIGVGEKAERLVKAEKEFIDAESDRCEEMTPLEFQMSGEGWAAFGVGFLTAGTVTLPALCEVLGHWLEEREAAFEGMPSASLIESSARPEAEEVMKKCREMKLRPSRVHGDLAPWNVRRGEREEVMMIDWEEGRRGDVPCWDLVHFVFQQAVLVDRLGPEEARGAVRESLMTDPARALLKRAGWGDNFDLLMASYLIAMATEDSHIDGIFENLEYKRIA